MSSGYVEPPRDHPALLMVAVGATVLVLPLLAMAGDIRAVTVPGIIMAALLVAAGRDSMGALAALGIVTLLWVSSTPRDLTAWSLVLALLMMTIHAAVALRSTAPPGAALGSTVLLRWLGRFAVVMGVTGLAYVLALGLDHLHGGGNQIVVAAALAFLGGLVLLLRHETLGEGPA